MGSSKLEREDSDPFKKAMGSDRMVVYSPAVLRSALFNAVVEANVEDVRLCVDRGASVCWRDEGEDSCGLTALQAAICAEGKTRDKAEVVRFLVSQGAGVDDVDYVESSALHFCAALGNAELIDLIIKSGACPNARDAEELTPLHLAVNQGHERCVRALLNNWAKVDVSDTDASGSQGGLGGATRVVSVPGASLYIARRGTPLHVSAAADRPSVARILLDEGGATASSSAGPHGCTPLHIACRAGHLEVCELLLSRGADPRARDDSGEEPLHRCAENGDLGIARLLLKGGAEADCANDAGLTPLHVAAALGRREFIEMLVSECGADPNRRCSRVYRDWDGGRTPIHYCAHSGDLNCFLSLVALGADPRAVSSVGWPPLFYACESNAHEIVKWIVQRDAADGVHFVADKGRTALMVAAMHNATESAVAIMEEQPFAARWRDETGRTALHWAAKRGQQEVMEAILKRGGDKDLRDANGATCGELFPNLVRPPPKRQWEEERRGPQGEATWNYRSVMEQTSLRYLKVRLRRLFSHSDPLNQSSISL